jgi:hypothetical protein
VLTLVHAYKPCRFCKRTSLHGPLDRSLIDQIPGRQNDRKTLLGELNWIFTAITDTIAWNVLPRGTLFMREIMFLGNKKTREDY